MMTDHSATLKIEVESPIGAQAIENYIHYQRKVASEAKERWDIDIEIKRVDP